MVIGKYLVSICIPTYNGAKYLGAALESIEQQTYRNLEIVISDDVSQDETLHILETYSRKTNFPIRILKHDPSGIGANWNNCVKNANGAYIKFLFQDDLLAPPCIEKMVAVLSTNKEIGLVSAKRKIIIEGEETKEVKEWLQHYGDLQSGMELGDNEMYVLDRTFFKDPLFTMTAKNFIGEPSGILFRKSLIAEVVYFREDMIQILDVEFYNRVLKKSKIAILNKKLYSFRIHGNQATSSNTGKDEEDLLLYKKLLLKQYFWCLNSNLKQQLLDLFFPFGGRVFRKLRKISS